MKNLIIAAIVIVAFGLGVFAFISSRIREPENIPATVVTATPTETLLGGDRDEHGCITSSGYTWCEPKNKCLRTWEEECYESLEVEIETMLSKKYDRPIAEVNVTISKQTDNFAAGSVLFGEGGPGEGGIFLARKVDNVWEVVFDGNGNVDCDKMRKDYGFPDEILVPNFCN